MIHRMTSFDFYNIMVLKGDLLMKKSLYNFYALIMMALFIVYNIIFRNLKIGGLLYEIFMITLIVVNIVILIVLKKDIKFKSLVIIAYFFLLLFSKDTFQCIFSIFNMLTLIVTGFIENHCIKVITILITTFFAIFSIPLFFYIFAFIFVFGLTSDDYIYDDHYYCENNFEVYSYSAGAMDEFHYNIGRHYEILDIDNIIYIFYDNIGKEVPEEEYDDYLKNHKCRLASDVDGSK